ncbi:hypothetical protein QJQ45_004088 [Haematococcus lacustris]|nr:hypothetical protein QJQ45_004088 [Haematococcus lacustris]
MANAGQPIIALAPNTLLNNGRYRIERELNREWRTRSGGGTAVVYAAEDTTTQQYVALKVMNGPDQVPVKVVKREIAFSAAARHDNIVRLLDVFAEKAQLIIVWELISGPDLLDLLNEHEGRMPEPMAAFFFCQLLQAVMFMHNNGFCHRDIKPENCMVQRASHQLKLIDFGLSKHLESARTLGVGTPDYLSPEMLQVWTNYTGTPVPYDARAVDAWAMGVLMFLLITGKYPFEDPGHPNNLAHTIHNVLAGRMCPFPDHMSAGCRELISGLLRIDPRQLGHGGYSPRAAQQQQQVSPRAPSPYHANSPCGEMRVQGGVGRQGGQHTAAAAAAAGLAAGPAKDTPDNSPRVGMGRKGSGGGSGTLSSAGSGSGLGPGMQEWHAAGPAKAPRSTLSKMRDYFKRKLDGGSGSAVSSHQPCEEELDRSEPTRPEDWKPQPGQVQHRLLRSAWSKRFEAPVRGLMWCPQLDQATPGDIGKWVDRDWNAALNLQRAGDIKWRPLELCRWQHRGTAPAKGKEYPALGFKKLRD